MDISNLPPIYQNLVSPAGFVGSIIGTVVFSLISAFVVKLLIAMLGHKVQFAFVWLLSVILGFFSSWLVVVAVLFGQLPGTVLVDWVSITATTAIFMVIFALVARALIFDQDGEPVPLWKWILALVLQYIVYGVITFVVALAVGMAINTSDTFDWADPEQKLASRGIQHGN